MEIFSKEVTYDEVKEVLWEALSGDNFEISATLYGQSPVGSFNLSFSRGQYNDRHHPFSIEAINSCLLDWQSGQSYFKFFEIELGYDPHPDLATVLLDLNEPAFNVGAILCESSWLEADKAYVMVGTDNKSKAAYFRLKYL